MAENNRPRIKTGVSNLDNLTEGGFEKNSTNLVVGASGSGKSIFATQFLVEGMKKGEKCLYVTFEEKKFEVYANMLRFGWDLAEYEKKGLFVFLEYTPEKVRLMLEEGGGAIESIIVRNKISRLAIDSITSFALLFENELEKREAALALFNMIRNWNSTALLTYEGNPTRESSPSHDSGPDNKAIEFESDSIILLYFIRVKDVRQRYIEILKMRGTEHSKSIYQFHIKDNEGILIEKEPKKGVL